MPHPPVITAARPIAWAAGAAYTAAIGSDKGRIPDMSSNSNDKNLSEPSEMQSLLSRLSDLERAQSTSEEQPEEETTPKWDAPPGADAAPSEAKPVEEVATEELAPVTESEAPPLPETPSPPVEA